MNKKAEQNLLFLLDCMKTKRANVYYTKLDIYIGYQLFISANSIFFKTKLIKEGKYNI